VTTEFSYFVGLASVIGGALAHLAVIRPALRSAGTRTGTGAGIPVGYPALARRRAADQLGWSGWLLALVSYGQLAARVSRADPTTGFGDALGPARIWRYIRTPAAPGEWVSFGTLVLAQNALLLLVAIVLVGLMRPGVPASLDRSAGAALLGGIAGTAVISVPTKLTGGTADDLVDRLLDQVHIVAACSWLGGLAFLAVLARLTIAGPRDSAGPQEGTGLCWALVWQRFSVLAMTAVGALLASGSWLLWKHVGGPDELLSTGYGRFLLVKLLLVASLITAGGYNQFVLTPRAARARAAGDLSGTFALTLRHFPAVVTVEAALGGCVLLIVPFLSGSARAQAGAGAAPALDARILALGLLLVGFLAGSLYTAHRVAVLLVRRAGPTGQ
jgi:putative copper export protein